MKRLNSKYSGLGIVGLLMLSACASIGHPEGGPRDVEPPVYVKSNPMPGSLNVNKRTITIEFNENVQLDDAINKVIVSPAQQNIPTITANGHRITVQLRDSLLPNTTYTIDFSNAIKDLNEGNVLDGFAIDFSTGPTLDSLQVSGMVFQASNLEPAQGIIVGAYLQGSDSAITNLKFDRITKTNQLGQFTLRNLKAEPYRIYALKDNNRDFHWDRTEDIAFLDSLVTPYTSVAVINDTIQASDSITPKTSITFLPNDIILSWFNEDYKAQYLKEYNHPDRQRLTFMLGAPTDTLPTFVMLNGPMAGYDVEDWAVLNANASLDSLVYWIDRPEVLAQDSILLEATYQRVDSADRLVWKTDTLKLNFRPSKKAKKEEAKKDTTATDSVPQIEFLNLALKSGTTADLNKPIVIECLTPIASLDSAGVHMQMLVDSVWTDTAIPAFTYAGEYDRMKLSAEYAWQAATKYKLIVDSTAITDIYGLHNKPFAQEITTRDESDYSSIYFRISGLRSGTPAFVELLNSQDAAVAIAPVVNGAAEMLYIAPGTYYARLIIDSNSNMKWDTGNLLAGVQPEEVYYYPKSLSLKKNWDVEQAWDIYSTALDLQKPDAIKKNKPPRKAGEINAEKEAAEDDDTMDATTDQWGNYQNPFDPASSRKSTQTSSSGTRR